MLQSVKEPLNLCITVSFDKRDHCQTFDQELIDYLELSNLDVKGDLTAKICYIVKK